MAIPQLSFKDLWDRMEGGWVSGGNSTDSSNSGYNDTAEENNYSSPSIDSGSASRHYSGQGETQAGNESGYGRGDSYGTGPIGSEYTNPVDSLQINTNRYINTPSDRSIGGDITSYLGGDPYGWGAKAINTLGGLSSLVNPLFGTGFNLTNSILSGNWANAATGIAGAINPVAGLFSNFINTAATKGIGGVSDMFAKGALNSELAKSVGPYTPLASLGVNALFNAGKSALSDSTPGSGALASPQATQTASSNSTPGSLGSGGSSNNSSSDEVLKKLLFGGVV